MKTIKIYKHNYVMECSNITLSGIDPEYDISNIMDNDETTLVKTQAIGESADLIFNWESEKTIDTIVIRNHNLSNIKIEYKDSNDIWTPIFEAGVDVGTIKIKIEDTTTKSLKCQLTPIATEPVSIGDVIITKYSGVEIKDLQLRSLGEDFFLDEGQYRTLDNKLHWWERGGLKREYQVKIDRIDQKLKETLDKIEREMNKEYGIVIEIINSDLTSYISNYFFDKKLGYDYDNYEGVYSLKVKIKEI